MPELELEVGGGGRNIDGRGHQASGGFEGRAGDEVGFRGGVGKGFAQTPRGGAGCGLGRPASDVAVEVFAPNRTDDGKGVGES